MRTITMADGTAYHCTRCGAADGFLWLDIEDYDGSIVDAAVLFSDAEKTKSIKHEWDGNDKEEYDGYTELVRVGFTEKTLNVVLEKEKKNAGEAANGTGSVEHG